MKLDPVFTVKENKLYKISDNSQVEFCLAEISDKDFIAGIKDESLLKKITAEKNSICSILIAQKTIEPEPEAYNEEFLAELRDALKVMEEKGLFAVLNVCPGLDDAHRAKVLSGTCEDDAVSGYVMSIKHTARRVKDCESVAGVFIREDFTSENAPGKVMVLQDELLVKHAQYVFFADSASAEKIRSAGAEYSDRVVFI